MMVSQLNIVTQFFSTDRYIYGEMAEHFALYFNAYQYLLTIDQLIYQYLSPIQFLGHHSSFALVFYQANVKRYVNFDYLRTS